MIIGGGVGVGGWVYCLLYDIFCISISGSVARTQSRPLFPFLGFRFPYNPFKAKRAPFLFLGYS